jgi:hypothetical protein
MTHALLRLSLLLIGCFGTTLTLMQARPYDDQGLRDVLMSPDCSSPCFMGIQPGVTTLEEAVDILKHHAWVKDVEVKTLEYGKFSLILWSWNGQQPAFLDMTMMGRVDVFHINVMDYRAGTVAAIQAPTLIPYGTLYLTMGGGRSISGYWVKGQEMSGRIFTIYNGFAVDARLECPTNPDRYWRTPVSIGYGLAFNGSVLFACHRTL